MGKSEAADRGGTLTSDGNYVGRLITKTPGDFSGPVNAALLEQYKLYVQSAEQNSARRIGTSRYLLTLNVALIALYGFQSGSFGETWLVVLARWSERQFRSCGFS